MNPLIEQLDRALDQRVRAAEKIETLTIRIEALTAKIIGGKDANPVPAKVRGTYVPWSALDQAEALRMAHDCDTEYQIGAVMNRKPSSVRSRLNSWMSREDYKAWRTCIR